MKVFLLLLPAWLSALVLAAHFLRAGNLVLLAAALALMPLLFVRRPWAARVLQIGLGLGALDWAWTLFELAAARQRSGQPFHRLAVILGAVTLITAASALLFRTPALRRHYRTAAVAAVEPAGDGTARP